MRILVAAVICGLAVTGHVATSEEEPALPRPDVYSLHVVSEVRNRYAKTLVTSRVANTANQTQEVSFDAVLPETAFISGFVIEMDGKAYSAYVRGKEQARQEYQRAVDSGRGAAHVQLSARDANVVSVSVNVEAQKKVTFNLTYEELLQRELGAYNLRINLNPGQIVNDLSVEVHINETSDISVLQVPSLRESNEVTVQPENTTNPLAQIERPGSTTATVRWAPTKEEQAALRAEGVKGQLLVRYDVDHAASPNQILVSEDGYFVHFFSPPDLPPLPKYIVFVLDVSGSMSGHKIEQLKEAMLSILDELRTEDTFTLISFSSRSQVWWPGAEPNFPDSTDWYYDRSLTSPQNESDLIVPATSGNVARAKEHIRRLHAGGSTSMHNALNTALRVSHVGGARPNLPLLMVLLTDGQPTDGSSDGIVSDFTAKNRERGATLFTLAFGEDADFSFLKRLALRNGGFGRRIYEAADAHLQLRNFYREVASPLLSRVNFTYGDGQVEENSLTRTSFRTLFRGGELVVCGRFIRGPLPVEPLVVDEGTNHSSSPVQVQSGTSGERLWAFLTVRQLLDRDAATPDQTLKDMAKQIALKYSFVTPVTSLVVVKPNETSAVDPERADPSTNTDGSRRFTNSRHRGWSSSSVSRSNNIAPASVGASMHSYGGRTIYAMMPPPRHHGGLSKSFDHRTILRPTFNSTTPEVATTEASRTVSLLNVSDVLWLSPATNGSQVTIEVNGTRQTYELATNQTEAQLEACTAPEGDPGHCRHLPSCVLSTFVSNVTDFLPYFCIVDTRYLGACCPDNLFPSVSS